MQNPDTFGNSGHTSRLRDRVIYWLTILLCITSLLVAGALGAMVRTGGTGKYFAFGVIEDFGSIVVNGVHYDDTQANIIIDGNPGQPRAALKLGMVVEIEGDRSADGATGRADVVRVNRTLFGQVERLDTSSGGLGVLSQTVSTNPQTRYEGMAGLATVAIGDWVAIHGLSDPAKNTLVATLVERLPAPATGQSEIRGIAGHEHDGRFRIGGLGVSAPGVAVDNGGYVAVKGVLDPASGVLVATSVVVTAEVDVEEEAETEVEGYADDVRSHTDFTVAGVVVDANRASFSGGTDKDLKQGVRLVVEGVMRNGVLVAEEIEFKGLSQKTATRSSAKVEVEGFVSLFASADEFVVNGRRVDAGAARISNKSRLALVPGIKVHVKGRAGIGGSIAATSVIFAKP